MMLALITYAVARSITVPSLMAGSAWLIARYKVIGVIASVLAGWAILYCVYHAWPAPPGEWDEDGEEIYYTAPILMMIWCFPILGCDEPLGFCKEKGGSAMIACENKIVGAGKSSNSFSIS